MKNSTRLTINPHFHAECLADARQHWSVPAGYHQLDIFEMIWIKEGRGTMMVDLEKRPITDNTLYCLFPGQIHRMAAEQDLVGYKIAFSGDFLSAGNAAHQLPAALNYPGRGERIQVMRLNSEVQPEIEEVVRTIVWEYANDQQLKADMLHGLLRILIAYFSRRGTYDLRAPGNDEMVFSRFMNMLDRDFRSQKQVSAYAADMAVTSNYLSEVVKRVSGYSASHHIQQRILLEAKRKAITTRSSMKTIGLELGFDDSSTFSKFFKTKTGVNFSDFRSGWVHA
ncbi:AraC family transcriptional regulator [Dyadobacter beijingensis]|uniref:AraC family transcriptional regulator n=1 Tax=Dyadobacter beijingensis TaxID=365489 RepID=A0ABQ2IHZ9_9BACT|nr:helix-turn-helix transcriptional regulator [Dyadobacter beijingensis]GGN12149.1 AraC family transcriptional regulator [Dyadobacter beijingensis]